MKTALLNSAFELPADGWCQIMPLGEFPVDMEDVGPDGKPCTLHLVQVCDAAAAQAMFNRYAAEAGKPGFAGMLVDFDHFSHDTDKSSRAAGWAMAMQNRTDGLYGQIRWTASGEPAVRGGDFRFISPVFDYASAEKLGGNRVRPTQLLNMAITNDPNMKGRMRPLSNRGGGTAGNSTGKEPSMDLKQKVCQALGLPAESDDDAVVGKLQDMANCAKETPVLKNRVQELERTQLEAEVEKDLIEFAPVIANRDDVKAQLMLNRDATRKLLGSLKPATTPPATELPNRRQTTLPQGEGDQSAAAAAADGERNAKILNRANELQRSRNVTFSRAWDLAAAEIPNK